jgi:predicted nucleic-acid-binding Zn-ribbon protein
MAADRAVTRCNTRSLNHAENYPSELSMSAYKPCPKCGGTQAQPVGFTWWGGVLGPKLFTHVKCAGCGMAYNGKTGRSNDQAIDIYVGVSLVIGVAAGIILANK